MECSKLLLLTKIMTPNAKQDDRHVFDNRIAAGANSDLLFVGEKALQAFIELKFSFLNAITTTLKSELSSGRTEEATIFGVHSVSEAASRLGLDLVHSEQDYDPDFSACADCVETAGRWEEIYADELKVYLLRIGQLPTDAVHDAWYNAGLAFQEWSVEVRSLIGAYPTADLETALGTVIPVCLEDEAGYLAHLDSMIDGSARASGFDVSSRASISALRTNHLDTVLDEVKSQMLTESRRLGATPEGALTAGLKVLRKAYGLRVCDYLRVTHTDQTPRLELLATSWEGDIHEVRANEATYTFAAGITGSIFLCRPGEGPWWVGTMSLANDPRQSLRHAMLYKSVYQDDQDRELGVEPVGHLESFWIYPVFDGESLIGALRFIEPEGFAPGYAHLYEADELGQRGPASLDVREVSRYWPSLVRTELALTAQWFGDVLPVLLLSVPGGREDSVAAEVLRYRPAQEAGAQRELLPWIPSGYLAFFLQEVSRIASMRSEHRSLGCSVVIGSERAVGDLVGNGNSLYTSVSTERQAGELDRAYDLFGRVVRGAGLFVCPLPKSGQPGAVIEYSHVISSGEFSVQEAATALRGDPELCIVDVDGRRDLVRMYESGFLVADYFLNEKTGRWRLRVMYDLHERLRGIVPATCSDSVLDQLLQLVIDYSYDGHGGLVVLAPGTARLNRKSSDFGFRVQGMNVATVPKDQFVSVVSVDGGTWVDTNGSIRQAGILFKNVTEASEPRLGGARWQAGRAITSSIPDSVAFMISANREVTVFAHGQTEHLKF